MILRYEIFLKTYLKFTNNLIHVTQYLFMVVEYEESL